MKRFELWQYDQETKSLEEAKTNGSYDPQLAAVIDDLNMWWMENAIEKGFLNPTQKPNARKDAKGNITPSDFQWTLFPIMFKPYDRIIKGGIAVIGENPGLDKSLNKKLIQTTKKLMKSGKFPNVRNEKGEWYEFKSQGYRPSPTSNYDTKVWKSTKSREKGLVEYGSFPYHAKFLTMLKGMGLLEDFLPRIMHTNMMPFTSTGANFNNKKVVEEKSREWMEAYIKVAKPSIVVTTAKGFSILKKMGMKETDVGGLNVAVNFAPSSKAFKTGDFQGGSFYKTGVFRGVPVIRFMHWSSPNGAGGPSSPTFKNPWKRELFKQDIKRLMSPNPKEVKTVVSKVTNKAIAKLTSYLKSELDMEDKEIDAFYRAMDEKDRMEVLEMIVGRNSKMKEVVDMFSHYIPGSISDP